MALSKEDYRRKLYALLQLPPGVNRESREGEWAESILKSLHCWGEEGVGAVADWWDDQGGKIAQDIASSSDRVNLQTQTPDTVQACHPISGQKQTLQSQLPETLAIDQEMIAEIQKETDPKKVFWWFWRFYPELLAKQYPDALLSPAHSVLPDCPLHSYQSTVSALVGALSNTDAEKPEDKVPYLLLFSFSPVQEFIKASRKFLDFWAGSYLLHYLSAQLCWYVAKEYGPDSVIVPSLWSQEIFDALMLQDDEFQSFEESFKAIAPEVSENKTPVERFKNRESNILSTAGFPNMITVIVPGKAAAEELGQQLTEKLVEEWQKIGIQVRDHIRDRVINWLGKQNFDAQKKLVLQEAFPNLLQKAFPELTELNRDDLAEVIDRLTPSDIQNNETLKAYWHEITTLQDRCAWHWPNLWEQQLSHSWEPYWAGVPLGNPQASKLEIQLSDVQLQEWLQRQQSIAFSPEELKIPTAGEKELYEAIEESRLNVGSWWGPLQQRLIVCLNAVKNTRNWQIPAAPGGRSTISGQFSAVHPWLKYHGSYREGGGLPESTMRLFWLIVSKAYPGLFDGSERLNALELSKRMAWIYGGVAESLGIQVQQKIRRITQHRQESSRTLQWEQAERLLYERFSRFPNLSSIAAARFIHDSPEKTHQYLEALKDQLEPILSRRQQQIFRRLTEINSSKLPKTDTQVKTYRQQQPDRQGKRLGLNGVMFSSKWLSEDLGLAETELRLLRDGVDAAHQTMNFKQGSPGEWWVILLSDGDGMGNYVSGKKLLKYDQYLMDEAISPGINRQLLDTFQENTRKRMGPATHVGLNRALLDFSNRLVPHLTEERFCGRVIYSGGDDVMAVLPLEDLPGYLISLRAAWCGGSDPHEEFLNQANAQPDASASGYWFPSQDHPPRGIQPRPHFTMGETATMSSGVVFAHKSVPLPTVLESLWTAEGDRAKAMPGKNGICFRVIYGNGNQLEALMSGKLLEHWWEWVKEYPDYRKKLSPLLYRLAEELPRRIDEMPEHPHLFSKAAKVLMERREDNQQMQEVFDKIEGWLDCWEKWAREAREEVRQEALNRGKSSLEAADLAKTTPGTAPKDLGKLLRFTAFWIDKRVERWQWIHGEEA